MLLKYKIGLTIILSGLFFTSASQALKLSDIVSGVSTDVTIVTAQGSCSANPFTNDAPCAPTIARCPSGKIPINLKKVVSTCTSAVTQPVKYQISGRRNLATTTTTASGYVSCNSISKSYYIYPNYYPEKVGYSPLCNPTTKTCSTFNYTVTARCVTSPLAGYVGRLGLNLKNIGVIK